MTKFLISVPVAPLVDAPEDRVATAPLKQSRWPIDMPSSSVMSVPRLEELIHLDFGTDETGFSMGMPGSRPAEED